MKSILVCLCLLAGCQPEHPDVSEARQLAENSTIEIMRYRPPMGYGTYGKFESLGGLARPGWTLVWVHAELKSVDMLLFFERVGDVPVEAKKELR